MKSLLITLYLAFIFATCTYAQVVSNPSPNVASFMVTKTFPSALPTGVPDITVPVYNMTYEGLTVPIELSYNVNAVKPDLHPSWVGLGWSLIAGGAINRVVNDKPDDLLYCNLDAEDINKIPSITNVGYYYNHAALSGSDWASTSKIEQYTDDWKSYESSSANMDHPDFKYLFPAPFTIKDYQPDEFSFSFLGYSGTFYLNDAGQWQIRCDKHFKLESTITTNGFTRFTLTDLEGIKYIFGDSAIESTQQVFAGDEQRKIPKTWYLVEVLFPNGKTINFNYASGNAQVAAAPLKEQFDFSAGHYYLRLSCSVAYPVYLTSITTENHNIIFKHSDANDLAYTTAPFAGEVHYYWSLSTARDYEFNQYIDAKTVPHNSNDITPYAHWYDSYLLGFLPPYVYYPNSTGMNAILDVKGVKLDTVTLVNKATGAIQNFSFNYIDTATERLKLLSMKQSSPISAKASTYSFAYNTTKLPDYLSEKTDSWGYYNGKAPRLDSTQAGFNQSRSPDSTYAKAEVLTGVTYPTGGSTTYDYELNTASKQYEIGLISDTTANFFVGGLRIRKITNHKSTGSVADFTTYTYNKPGSSLSSGIAAGDGGLLWESYSLGPGDYSTNPVPVGYSEAYFTSIYPGENQAGSHIGYSYVTQHFSDGSSTLNQFSNFDTSSKYQDELPINAINYGLVNIITSKSFLRGKLLDQKTYNAANVPLSEKTIHYSHIYADSGYVRSMSTYCQFDSFYWDNIENSQSIYWPFPYTQYYVTEPQLPADYYGQAAKIYTYSYLPVTETDKLFNNPLHPVVTTKTYTYDTAKLNLLSTVTTNSKGQTEETDNLYPPDMVNRNRDPGGVYAAMTTANDISPVIESTRKVNGTQTVFNSTSYKQPYINIFRPDSTLVQYGTGSAVISTKYTSYDGYGNLTTALNKGVLPTSYIYDATGQFVVAKIENASSSNEVFLEDFEHSDSGTTGAGHSGTHYFLGDYLPDFHTPGSRAYVIDFWYHTTGNTWKYKKQPYVMHATLLPVGANALDDIRIYPADAEVTTYTNDPLAGLTSETDPRGNITYYEYDEFQRLVNIKDQYGNIKTHYCYNYAGQETDCAVSTVLPPPQVPPATGIYARVEISDVSVENSEDGDGGSTSFQTGNVCIKLYADPDGTIPLTLSSDLNITLTETTQVNDYVAGNSTDTEYAVYTIPAGNNSYCLGMMDLDDLINYLDEFGNVHYNESIYNYNLTSGSTIYTVIPTVYP